MNIRTDLKAVAPLLDRLVEYAKVFNNNDMQRWGHLKHNEDFRLVYALPDSQRTPLEEIYGTGRGLAGAMSDMLYWFNDAARFPTLKSFVDSFSGGWIDEIHLLKTLSEQAKLTLGGLAHKPWAMGKMIALFDEQLGVLIQVKQTLEAMKQSDLYKWEAGSVSNTIHTTNYFLLLQRIHSAGKMFERLPGTYSGKGEEALRDHLLVALGDSAFGSATGETFNKSGKTDILVRRNNTNELIGECKFWGGRELYWDTISQLLRYLSWRDTQAAVILFVKNNDFSAVLTKIKECTPQHANFLRFVSETDGTWLNYEFKMNDNANRAASIAVMAYHIPD